MYVHLYVCMYVPRLRPHYTDRPTNHIYSQSSKRRDGHEQQKSTIFFTYDFSVNTKEKNIKYLIFFLMEIVVIGLEAGGTRQLLEGWS